MGGMIAELARGEEGIMNAERALRKMNREREQWARALWREKRAKDYLDYKTRLEEALAEGREEGKAEGRLEAARSMKADGFSPEQIQKYTGLSPEDIEAL
jgi:predicted transposase/invertase (TIGR01784 family)